MAIKSLAKIEFEDGSEVVGFVVYVDDETFDVYKLDNVYNEKILDENSDGDIMIESEEDAKGIDWIFTKACFKTGEINSIVMDISHKFAVDKTYFFGTSKNDIYKNEKKIQDKLNGKPQGRKTVFTNFPASIKTDSFTIMVKTKEK